MNKDINKDRRMVWTLPTLPNAQDIASLVEKKVITAKEARQVLFEEHLPYSRKDGRCHDCGCLPNEKHYEGCDVEECPVCHKQLFICEHRDKVAFPDRIPFGKEDVPLPRNSIKK